MLIKILSPNIESSTWTPWISWWDCFKWPKPLVPNTNPEPVQTLDPRFSKPADTAGEDDTEPGPFAETKVGFTMCHYVHNINIIKHMLSDMVKANFNTSYVQTVHVRPHVWSKTQGSPVSCPIVVPCWEDVALCWLWRWTKNKCSACLILINISLRSPKPSTPAVEIDFYYTSTARLVVLQTPLQRFQPPSHWK